VRHLGARLLICGHLLKKAPDNVKPFTRFRIHVSSGHSIPVHRRSRKTLLQLLPFRARLEWYVRRQLRRAWQVPAPQNN
jgi:hypothetical protein